MRKTIIILLILISIKSFATNYYVSETGGGDTLLIGEVNAAIAGMSSGDSLLFKCGQTFNPTTTITVGVSGVNIGSYGIGVKPVISGFETLSSFSIHSGNIYKSSSNASTNLNCVSWDGVNVAKGRYPNDSYLTIDSHTSTTSITDAELSGIHDLTGSEVVIRKRHWILDVGNITNFSGTTITYSGNSYEPQDGWGYFIQNDLQVLDTDKEWYCDGADFYCYFSDGTPSSHTVKVSILDEIFNITASGVVVSNIDIRGGNTKLIEISAANDTIINCDLSFSGNTGIEIIGTGTFENILLTENNLSKINNLGIYASDGSGSLSGLKIESNNLSCVAMLQGMGGSDDGQYYGIRSSVDGVNIVGNVLDSIGYNGISSGNKDNVTISYNHINNACLIKDDGAGIYLSHGSYSPSDSSTYFSNINVYNNIVDGSGGFKENDGVGSDGSSARGMYSDVFMNGVYFHNNTILNTEDVGINLNQPRNTVVRGNVMIDCAKAFSVSNMGDWNIYNNDIKSNQIYISDTSHYVSKLNGDVWNDPTFCRIDSNMYILGNRYRGCDRSIYEGMFRSDYFDTKWYNLRYELDRWIEKGFDVNSYYYNEYQLKYNTVSSGSEELSNNGFTTDISGWSSTSNGGTNTTTWDSGKLKCIYDNSGDDDYTTDIINTGINISGNKGDVYEIKIKGYTSNPQPAWIRAYMIEFTPSWATSNQALLLPKTNGWTTGYLQLQESSTNGRLYIRLLNESGTIYLDSVSLKKVSVINNTNDVYTSRYNATMVPVTAFADSSGTTVDGAFTDGVTLGAFESVVAWDVAANSTPTTSSYVKVWENGEWRFVPIGNAYFGL